MIFEQIATGGCQSYLVGCADTSAAALIDPELSQIDRYLALAARDGLRIRYVIDTHTHADHFSATRQLARQLGVPRGHAPGEPGAVRRHAGRRRRDGGGGQAAAAGAAHAGPHRRLDVPAGRGPGVHRRHAADRRHRPHRPADRRSGRTVRQPVRSRAEARPGAQDFPGARLQGPPGFDDRAGDRHQSAPAEARTRRVRRDDEATSTCRCRRISPRRCAPT